MFNVRNESMEPLKFQKEAVSPIIKLRMFAFFAQKIAVIRFVPSSSKWRVPTTFFTMCSEAIVSDTARSYASSSWEFKRTTNEW